jgi:hypothetical protein
MTTKNHNERFCWLCDGFDIAAACVAIAVIVLLACGI